MALNRIERRRRVHYRIRKHVNGTAERPRMVVFRSNKQIYVQVVDDQKGVTLVAAASNDKVLAAECKGKNGKEAAAIVGKGDRRACQGERYHMRSLSTVVVISIMVELNVWPTLPVKAVLYSNRNYGKNKC